MLKAIIYLLIVVGCTSANHESQSLRNIAQSLPMGCPELEADHLSLVNLEKFIRHPNCNIKSVDDVLKLMPRELFMNGTLVYKSRSLQGPHKIDYMNPRGILHYDGRFFLTYNGNPLDAGYNALELAEVNTSEKDYRKIMRFQEISFPKNSKSMSWSQVQKQIHITQENPEKCTRCHGVPARPVFPSYPLWVGYYGFANGKKDPVEEKNYQILAAKAKSNPQSRYHRYEFDLTAELFMRNEGLNDILGNINSAVTAKKIKKTADYDSYKYAIYSALFNCQDSPSFLGDKLNDHIKHLDANLKISSKWSKENVDKKIRQIVGSQKLFMLDYWRLPIDPRKMTDFYSKYSEYILPDPSKTLPKEFINETAKNFKDHMGTIGGKEPFMLQLAVDTFNMQSDYERMYYTPTLLRLIFEGRGIPLNTWALDLTQPTYRFHMTLQSIVKHLATDDNDPLISELLKVAEKGNPGSLPFLTPEIDDNKVICDKLKISSVKKLAAVKFKANPISYSHNSSHVDYPSVFQSTCIKCHGQYDFMAPYIPFENREEMQKWSSIGKNIDLLRYRVFYAPEDDRMPPTRHLSDDEKESIKTYLNKM